MKLFDIGRGNSTETRDEDEWITVYKEQLQRE